MINQVGLHYGLETLIPDVRAYSHVVHTTLGRTMLRAIV